ncbi:fam-a protein [Plasmodium berghei]|uniref:Fam-a protein n=2 Tax=Plasmodium berghei TaxID=5821 RepID=A0A509AJM6_PLABA|nr:fam-a protein [Plasmodium berghei ANKA]CXI39096.1 fam-a protein [Plasmodium berghei]SCM21685.1 fam-a protein [Plasmodium berghei]SCN24943.1 fam-a protein [Plasmodium berghei]SCO60028.1 fam-a protein [Plasmodium berghei]SCO61494.1 fam-a protein [Plasmodium berghei]|eukprot:XP_034421360.1 fam-a protein [Plasmodium berghei ANKA]
MPQNNKGYSDIIFFLLIILIYVSNKTFASEYILSNTIPYNTIRRRNTSKNDSLRKSSLLNTTLNKAYPINIEDSFILGNNSSNEAHEQIDLTICTNPEEIRKTTEIINDALSILRYHATSEENYKLQYVYDKDALVYFKKHGNTDIEKLDLKIRNSNKYNDVINNLWDPYGTKHFNDYFINGNVVRIYNPNLLMIQQRNIDPTQSPQESVYALASKIEISEDITVIIIASANVNDYNNSNKKTYKNKNLEISNSLNTSSSPESYIKEESKKTFNLSGFFIKKKGNYINVTYVNAMDDNTSSKKYSIKKSKGPNIAFYLRLMEIFLKK